MKRLVKQSVSALLALIMMISICFSHIGAGVTIVSAASGVGPIDVWDMGGVTEGNTELYTNHVMASDWNTNDSVSNDGKFVAVNGTLTTSFGDLTINYVANDRLYVNDAACNKTYGLWANSVIQFADDYSSNGIYYCNGTGGETRRYLLIDHVKAGDLLTVYMGSSNAVEYTMTFAYQGAEGTQVDSNSAGSASRFDFIAEFDGSYKIYTETTNGAKPVYYRVVRTPGIPVSGTIDLGDTSATDYTVSFTNTTTGQKTVANLDGTKFSAVLAPGYTYTAALSGATGIGFTNDTKQLKLVKEDLLTAKENIILKAEKKTTYTLSGSLVGFASDYNLDKLEVKLVPSEDANVDIITVDVDDKLNFTAICEPDVQYTVQLLGVNDYEVLEGNVISSSSNLQQNIKVATKTRYEVTGSFIGLPTDVTVTEITFINEEDDYVYTGLVKEGGYSVSLRAGAYRVSAVVDGYKTNTHVVVDKGTNKKDLLFVSTDSTILPMEHVSDIYVGYIEKEHNYNTVKEAVAACKAMNPTSEAERITVHIAPGVYREQIIIDTPYISFVNDEPKEEVKLTWYYGIGYQYYSCDVSGYFNEENAFDQYSKATAAKWGVATYVKSSATAFKAENIVFEASFNRYITDEELEDGVELSGTENIAVKRGYGLDVASKKATERAAAMCVEADNTEFYKCTFLGSQDTLYTGNDNIDLYFKNCIIEGNTDYIFGDGDAVFDGCELKWYGYTDSSTPGYITAARPTLAQNGYVFRNCVITGNNNTKYIVTPGYFGRPWGANANVSFMDTKLASESMINPAGWTSMSGNTAEKASYTEYNTTITDGTVVDISNRITGVVSVKPTIQVKEYFGDWTPEFFAEEEADVTFTTKPYVVDNGDINAPYPGHKLTVCYSLGANDASDASIIKWYSMKADGTETLVKSSTANVDKTYTISAKDQGSYIKVVVVPETLSGNKTKEEQYQVEATVKEGFENPDAEEGDVELGDGVNIFLAGDSTVKDYSVNGMYNNNIAQNMGSWGEFIQSFFDASKVNIVNYANGGRSSRNYINEGTLDKIIDKIGEGDYLFIQFGHNDCSNASGYLEDRYVPLGTPDANGVYPSIPGVKVNTPSSLVDKYGESFYSYDCGGTYKWYLQQYINAAKEKGAIPVLVTPVSRMYYDANGKIKPHHDSTDTTTGTQVTTNNAYVTAVQQLAEEQNVLLIDAFELTKNMYEDAYNADETAKNGVSSYGSLSMAEGDKTHSSKLGGFISAAYIAKYIQQEMKINISQTITMPSQVSGVNPDGSVLFTVNARHILTAFEKDSNGEYASVVSKYWSQIGQSVIESIGSVEDEGTPSPTAAPTVEPTAAPTVEPTAAPTVEPTAAPTVEPTVAPTVEPTVAPTVEPTAAPTVKPTVKPIIVDNVKNLKARKNTTTSITISWDKVSGATGYEVSYIVNGKWYTKNITATTTTQSSLKPGTTQNYKVRAYKTVGNNKVFSANYTKLKTTTLPAKMSVKVTKQLTSSIKLSWNKVVGATGYKIQVYKNKKWTTIKKTTGTSFTESKLISGTTYSYRVYAYKVLNGKTFYGSYNTIKTATKPGTPNVTVKAGSKKVTVSWKAINGASGYEIFRSTKKNVGFQKVMTLTKKTLTKATIKKLQPKKTYYFKVRAYKVVNNKKVYGSYSVAKKVIVK